MRFVQIPNIKNAWGNVAINTLSPSSYVWTTQGCGYQVLLQKVLQSFSNKSLILPPNRNIILGTIIHKIYELSQKGELQNFMDLKNKWEELIDKEKKHITDTYPTLCNASINDYDKRNSAIRFALGIIKTSSSKFSTQKKYSVFSEKWLDCSSIGLIGIADKIIVDNEYVDIIDYKSGYVTDDNGDIKEEYRTQLHLYAAMCSHISLGIPRTLSLIDIEGKHFDVPYSQDYCKSLLYNVKETILKLNNTISTGNFQTIAKPDLGMCVKCNCRHACQYRDMSIDSYYQTITGKVTKISSTNMLVLYSKKKSVYISGLDTYNVDSLQEYLGRTLTFVNVTCATQATDNNTYKTTDNTLIYEQL